MSMYHVHVPTASQPRSLTAGGAIADRDEPPAVLLAVQRAREALEVCERLSARRVEKFLAHTSPREGGLRAARGTCALHVHVRRRMSGRAASAHMLSSLLWAEQARHI